jgi:16S rRNA (uracil1498-N3)-methyltransferase
MQRIFLFDADLNSRFITIKEDKARYLLSVVRCGIGDRLIISDNMGNSYSSQIIKTGKREVTLEILEKQLTDSESPLNIKLLQGVLKGEKMDLVIQKATELGVTEIIPVITERSQIRETRKLLRWQKIAEEASRQSGRNLIPIVHEAADFEKFFGSSFFPANGIIFWEQGGENLSATVERFRGQKDINVFIGPEGGFSGKEVRTASEKGFFRSTLGSRTLRAETAAITVISIIQYELGDLGV